METLNLTFPGEPRAVQSVRFANIGGFVRKYQPKRNEDWKSYIRVSANEQLPDGWKVMDCPLAIKATFFFSPPKSWAKYRLRELQCGVRFFKTTKPDLTDNLMKGLIDALTGIIWRDDAIICVVQSSKEYAESPRIELSVNAINEGE